MSRGVSHFLIAVVYAEYFGRYTPVTLVLEKRQHVRVGLRPRSLDLRSNSKIFDALCSNSTKIQIQYGERFSA